MQLLHFEYTFTPTNQTLKLIRFNTLCNLWINLKFYMDPVIPVMPFEMRKLVLQLDEISSPNEDKRKNLYKENSCDVSKAHFRHNRFNSAPEIYNNAKLLSQARNKSRRDDTILSIDLKCLLSDKAFECFQSNGSNAQPISDGPITSIQSIFNPLDKPTGEPAIPILSSSKAEKNRLAQQAYRKRRAEHIKILEVRSSILSVIEEQLEKTQEQLAQIKTRLSACLKEKEFLQNELAKFKSERLNKAISSMCASSICEKDAEKSKPDNSNSNSTSTSTSTSGSHGCNIKSVEYGEYYDLWMTYP